MSVHIMHIEVRGVPAELRIGYDRPCGGFFLTIDHEDEFIYSNLWEKNPHPKTLAPFLEILKILDVSLPPAIFDEVEDDMKKNVGNKVVIHSIVDGKHERKEKDGPQAGGHFA